MKKALIIIIFLACSLITGLADNAKRDFSGIIHRLEIREMKLASFSVENLMKYLKLTSAPDPEIMKSQFIVETGWFRSKSFCYGNNICGMKLPGKRITTATGKMFGYARYSHWTDSVDDFLLWLHFHGLSAGYFDQVQKKCYSENGKYCELVMKVYRSIKEVI